MVKRRKLSEASERCAWRRLRDGDASARGLLAEHHVGLVLQAVNRLGRRYELLGLTMEDMLGSGYAILLGAIDTFDPSRGAFSTWAYSRLRMLSHAERDFSGVPEHRRRMAYRAAAITARLEALLFRRVSMEEVASEMGVDVDRLLEGASVYACPGELDGRLPDSEDWLESGGGGGVMMADCDLFHDPSRIVLRDVVVEGVLSRLAEGDRHGYSTLIVTLARGGTVYDAAKAEGLSLQGMYDRLRRLQRDARARRGVGGEIAELLGVEE